MLSSADPPSPAFGQRSALPHSANDLARRRDARALGSLDEPDCRPEALHFAAVAVAVAVVVPW